MSPPCHRGNRRWQWLAARRKIQGVVRALPGSQQGRIRGRPTTSFEFTLPPISPLMLLLSVILVVRLAWSSYRPRPRSRPPSPYFWTRAAVRTVGWATSGSHPFYLSNPDFDVNPGGRRHAAGAACQFRGVQSLCLFGGFRTSSNEHHGDLWAFNPVNQTWTWIPTVPQENNMTNRPGTHLDPAYPGARSYAGMVSLLDGKRVRLFGGRGFACNVTLGSSARHLQDVWDFDSIAEKWTFRSVAAGSETWKARAEDASFPGGTHSMSVWAVGNDLITVGGDRVVASKSTWRFLDANATWIKIADDPNDPFYAGADYAASYWSAANATRLYRWSSELPSTALYQFLVSASVWTQLAQYGSVLAASSGTPHAGARKYGRAEEIRPGVGLVMGGYGYGLTTGARYLTELWAFSSFDGTWKPIHTMFDNADFYPPGDIWNYKDAFPRGREAPISAVLENDGTRVMVLYGGRESTGGTYVWDDTWLLEIPDCGYGVVCEIPTYRCADGIRMNETDKVCSGHGWCTSENGPCVCQDEMYKGAKCEIWSCRDGNFMDNSSATPVCSGHGNCSSPGGVCQCFSHWQGNGLVCDEFSCADNQFHESMCNNKGYCTEAGGNCTCTDPGYTGFDCKTPIPRCADELFNNDPRVCSGHGHCALLDPNCVCDEPIKWAGYMCAYWQCDDGRNDTSFPCHGRGNCTTIAGKCDVCDRNYNPATSCRSRLPNPGGWGENDTFLLLFCLGIVAGVAIICGVIIGICICVCCCIRRVWNRKLEEAAAAGKKETALMETPPSDASLNLSTGLFVIQYSDVSLIEDIGSGGGGAIVFKAKWHGELVAFKVFRLRSGQVGDDGEEMLDQAVLDEFEREVSVSHPNLLRFFARIGIVMELCTGGDLAVAINRKTLKTLREKIAVLKGISSGMAYLHDREIIHRDLKPENVLLDHRGVPKIMDFGLSRVVGKHLEDGLTQGIGTVTHMAPELHVFGNYDSSVDVFAFAIVLFEVVEDTTRPYAVSQSVVGVKLRQDPDFRPKFTKPVWGEHPWLRDLTERCWASEPETRSKFAEVERLLEEKKNEMEKGMEPKTKEEGIEQKSQEDTK